MILNDAIKPMPAEPQYTILMPPAMVFTHQTRTPNEQIISQGDTVPVLERVELPTFGGMYLFYKDVPYPKKGFPYPAALAAVNTVKRFTMFFTSFASKDVLLPLLGFIILPFKKKTKILEKMLFNYCRLADWILTTHYLQEQFYSPCPRELRKLVYHFLLNLGISESMASNTARVIATLIEYDDAYMYRIEDIFSETSSEKMLLNPRKEIQIMINALLNREQATGENDIGGKFASLGKMIRFLLLVPRVKKAFKSALSQIDFTKLQLDDIDKYWCLMRNDYRFFNEPLQIREYKYNQIHQGKFPGMVKVSLDFNN